MNTNRSQSHNPGVVLSGVVAGTIVSACLGGAAIFNHIYNKDLGYGLNEDIIKFFSGDRSSDEQQYFNELMQEKKPTPTPEITPETQSSNLKPFTKKNFVKKNIEAQNKAVWVESRINRA